MSKQASFRPPLEVKHMGRTALLLAIDGDDALVLAEFDKRPTWVSCWNIEVDATALQAIRS